MLWRLSKRSMTRRTGSVIATVSFASADSAFGFWQCIMITGDNPLTATHVARDVEIVDRDVLILDLKEGATSETGMHTLSFEAYFLSLGFCVQTSSGNLSTKPKRSLSMSPSLSTKTY